MLNATKHGIQGQAAATIMMVDDEPTTLDVIEAFLQSEGYENFISVEDSREAMARAEENRPDIILLDLMMPHVGGLQILEAVREHPRLRHTPVVILTSSTDPQTKLTALELGATDFLAKPVDPSELALRLRNTLTIKAYQDQLTYFDPLTGLPNRRHFTECLDEFITRTHDEGADGAVLHLRLDRLREIDATFGRDASNEVVQIVAERLRGALNPSQLMGNPNAREVQILSRTAENEFLVLMEAAGRPNRAARIAQHVISQIEPACTVDGRELSVMAYVGIALVPEDGEDVETVLANANLALSYAQRVGGNDRFQFHDESLNAESRERLHLESLLRDAAERGELQLHYQPKVDLATGVIVGAEALMRWHSPVLGPVPPDRFIPIAEESDLIVRLGDFALRTACWQMRSWLDAGLPPICVAVNVSSRQFRSGDLENVVQAALAEFAIPAGQLVLEITESMIMEDPDATGRTLTALKTLGVTLSLDDFGTGYSSLSNLKHFPIDELKIDRGFVKGVPDDPDDAAIVAAVIAMGHALGLRLVAEGVEQEEQADFLRERGCQIYQGFLCSRPVGATEWPMLMARLQG
ncbi:MAG: EAL domain-containing protein [Myxococcales bacterium]|nr:EAL domain-containing protein [Myxococcales bacterium]